MEFGRRNDLLCHIDASWLGCLSLRFRVDSQGCVIATIGLRRNCSADQCKALASQRAPERILALKTGRKGMNWFLILIGIFVAGSLGLLLWTAGNSARSRKQQGINCLSSDLACKHVTNLSQIRQALDIKDFDYVSERFASSKMRNFKRERRQVVLKYL